MKTSIVVALVPAIIGSAGAADVAAETKSRSDAAVAAITNEEHRELSNSNCGAGTPLAWHPTYSAGWSGGYCQFTRDCNSPPYPTELSCCQVAYAGQRSGNCLAALPNPPTTSPTGTGGLGVYYPDYTLDWSEGYCVNTRPMPSGRPTYTTMLQCCKGAYGGQMSGKCLAELPSPPTTAPSNSAREANFFYPDYETPWANAGCKNSLPLPYNNVNDRPNYSSQLACCKNAYGGQVSGVCLSQLANPPTMSPTETGGLDVYYPDYATPWSEAFCINTRPLPSGRPSYNSILECCKGAYGGQASGACLATLPSPPTTSPTETGDLGVFYADYSTPWSDATCINARPLPSGRPIYATKLECCKGAYGGQVSGACLASLPNPPTESPTSSGGLTVFYPDYTKGYPDGLCINDGPLPSGRPSYPTKGACCQAAYPDQQKQTCFCDINPCFSCNCPGVGDGAACGLVCV